MIIMLDAGHGPNTLGKRSPNGMKEFEFNENVVQRLCEKLLTLEAVTVHFAHSNQDDVPLKQRTDRANKVKADCYISIHANAFGNNWTNAEGIETYVYTTMPPEAYRLAIQIQHNLVAATGRKDRGVKMANFHVLRETKMTAVLIECGFMTHRHEASLLQSSAYRELCADSIFQTLRDFYKLKKKTDISTPDILYRVQVGAFQNHANAKKLAADLKKKGFSAFILKS